MTCSIFRFQLRLIFLSLPFNLVPCFENFFNKCCVRDLVLVSLLCEPFEPLFVCLQSLIHFAFTPGAIAPTPRKKSGMFRFQFYHRSIESKLRISCLQVYILGELGEIGRKPASRKAPPTSIPYISRANNRGSICRCPPHDAHISDTGEVKGNVGEVWGTLRQDTTKVPPEPLDLLTGQNGGSS